MKPGKLTALAIAALFAAPLAVYAAGDSASSKGASSKGASSSAAGKTSDNGAEAMFKRLDKDKDGNLTMAEVKGTPHEKEFKQLDKNHDGKLTRAEHASAPEHQGKSATGGTAAPKSGSSGGSSKKY